jgi:tetratricopeptide (TPR) repeat protein
MLINFSQVCASLGRQDEAIAPLEARLAEDGLYRREEIQLHFALGKLYDKQKSYDRAFGHYRRGNDLEPVQFNRAAYRDWVSAVIETYNPEFMLRAPRARNTSEMPVFIIAMPRSGTTLLEQVLASHPLVHGAGETGDIASVSAELLPLIRGGTMTEKALDDHANRYLARLESLAGGAARVTDKTVNSFMDLGLIQLLFPKARIIHCVRNPLDTCLSCYFSKLSGSHPYSYNLDDLAAFYLQYHRIMQHWKRVLDLKFMEIRYEELVRDLEAGAKSMIDFLGLDWDPACLEFHKAQRQVTTISYDQVRKPIYTSSLNRWTHYAAHIEELRQALEGLTESPAT